MTWLYLISSLINLLPPSSQQDGFVYNANAKDEQMSEAKSNHQRHHSEYESSLTMWGAAIAIEVIYVLISDGFSELLPLFAMKGTGGDHVDETLLSDLVGVVCDFAVVASSCKTAISKVVEAAEDESDSDVQDGAASSSSAEKKSEGTFLCDYSFDVQRIHPALIIGAREMANYDIGAAVWTALNCILILWKNLQSRGIDENDENGCKALIDNCFAPSLAVMQHFLRRCPACGVICRFTLSGYLLLSRCVLPLCADGDFERQVVLTTLCKLTLPARGERESRRYVIQ